jgi:ribonucleotide reductase beta subunit family protein with ferritin-like domain
MSEITNTVSHTFVEPLLVQDNSRFTLFPIKHDDIYKMYKDEISSFWTVDELNFGQDMNDWKNKLNDDERYFISMILAFFSNSDSVVNENLALRFYGDVGLSEAKAFYSFQIAMETIHSEAYSLMINTYITDKEQQNKLFNAIDNFPCITKKINWAQKWISDKRSNFATRLIGFSIVEGIFFSGAFCSIFWLRQRGLMAGLCFSNEVISKDEALHTQFAVLLYSKIVKKLPKKKIYEIFKEAVDIEKEFITEVLPCKLIGMNADLMKQYIEYVADRLIVQLGYPKIFNSINPFPFMELISMETKTNFFEAKVSEYSLSTKTKTDDIFELNTDF